MRSMTTRAAPQSKTAHLPVKERGSARSPAVSAATKARSKAVLGVDAPKPKLLHTEIPGVYVNADGKKVDEHGVLLSIRPLQRMEADRDEEILGEPVTTPAQLLKRIALDPTLSLYVRMDAAKAAAPYYDRKMPLSLEGGGDSSPPIRTESSVVLKNLSALGPEERKAALALLEKLGVLG